jgi:chromate reductase
MTTERTTKIAAFAGSLRQGSYNRALLRAMVDRAPQSMEIETLDLHDVPFYNGDVEDEGDPEPVADLKRAIDEADGLLIVTPEYNHGVPAVTKNAVDWASRPPERVLSETPVAIAGASPGMTGTARAQSALRQALASVNAFVMQKPGVLVARAHQKFEEGELVDEGTGDFLEDFLGAFDDWIGQFAV